MACTLRNWFASYNNRFSCRCTSQSAHFPATWAQCTFLWVSLANRPKFSKRSHPLNNLVQNWILLSALSSALHKLWLLISTLICTLYEFQSGFDSFLYLYNIHTSLHLTLTSLSIISLSRCSRNPITSRRLPSPGSYFCTCDEQLPWVWTRNALPSTADNKSQEAL